MIHKNSSCRGCQSERLVMFLDLSYQPPANAFITDELIKNEQFYPLKTYVCEDCHLVQLLDVVDFDELFQNYVYFTAEAGATTPKHFSDYAKSIIERFRLTSQSFVVELGSNDGLLLGAFKKEGVDNVLGVDPAENVANVAMSKGIETIVKRWSEKVAREIKLTRGKADLIVGNNVVAHINDHIDLFTGIKVLLASQGVFVFEAPYLVDMFENLTFDTIYHEHLSSLSLRPVKRMVERLGLEVFDVEAISVQGKSMRVFLGHRGAHKTSPRVQEFLDKEYALSLNTVSAYYELGGRVHRRKAEITALLGDLKNKGKRIAGYGAPAKGNTLLNFFKFGPETLEYLTDESTKIGKLSPGMHIKIIDVKESRKNPPDYFLLLAWNYLASILEKESEVRKAGTKFIIPIGKEIKIL